MEKKANHFSGQIGFVLAAAGSAVGVGNLWRFPYLAAKDGGGLFLIVYLALVLTFGFTLLCSDIAIGRRTKKSAIGAYAEMAPKWKFLGILTFLVPVLIMTYYAVIGGWITKYAVTFLTGHTAAAAQDGYFTAFISSPVSPVVYALAFMGVTAFIVYNGVQGGIEKVSRSMMPLLLVLVVVIAGFSLTLRSTDAAGQCLVSSAVRGSRTLISVVLGAEKVEKENGSGYIVESFTETARLFDWGFDNFAPQQVLDENELIQEVPVALSKQVSTVAVHPAESADAMLPKDLDVSALTRTVTLDNETALAPIAAGDRLGEITVSYGDTTYVTVPLLAVADVSASRFLSLRHAIGEFFSQRSARIAVLALVVLVAALVLWFRFYGRNRRYGKPGSKQYRHHSYRGRRH